VGVLPQQSGHLRPLLLSELPPGQPGGDQVALIIPAEGWSGEDENEDGAKQMSHSDPGNRTDSNSERLQPAHPGTPGRASQQGRGIVRPACLQGKRKDLASPGCR
jgi:hypothetical protein